MHIADRSVFLAIARLLWAFDFQRVVDPETKREVVPDMNDLADGVMMSPNPFPADIRPRSAFKAECLREEWGKMLKVLDEQKQWKEIPHGLIWKDERTIE